MKIAVFHELPPGGALRAVNELARQLKKRHTVDLYYVSRNKIQEHGGYFSKVKFCKFVPKKWKGKNWKVRLYKDTLELYKLYRLHKKIAEEIKKGKYDIVFVHASEFTQSPFLLRFNLKNNVFYLHDPHYRMVYEPLLRTKNLNFSRRIYEHLNRFLRKMIDTQNVKSADMIIANSRYTQKAFERSYGIKCILGYLGVDQNFFKPAKFKKNIDVLFLGSYEEIDGLNLLKEALGILKKTIVVRLVLKEDEWINDDLKLRELYRRSKIVVCLAHNEPLGLVPLEAMACGVPVIGVNEGGYKETVVHNKTGFLIKRDPHELANRIAYLLSSVAKWENFSSKSRKIIEERWTWDKSAEVIEKQFDKLIQVNG